MLTKVYKYHTRFLKFAENFTTIYAEDLVQELYIKLDRMETDKIIVKGEVNKNYVFTIFRNMCIDFYRKRTAVCKIELPECEEDFKDLQATDIKHIEEQHKEHERIKIALRDEHFYYETLYLIYTSHENPSYRQLAKESGITLTTIHNDFQKIKKIINNSKTQCRVIW